MTSALFSMHGRRCLITGASLSVGRAIALGFAEHGADIAVHYAAESDNAFGFPDAAKETVTQIRAMGREAHAIEADLAAPGGPKRAFSGAVAALGQIDVVVVCASVQMREEFSAISAAELERQTRINFDARIELLGLAIPPMRARKRGRVLTIGSINQVRPEPSLAVYTALKAAQANLAINLDAIHPLGYCRRGRCHRRRVRLPRLRKGPLRRRPHHARLRRRRNRLSPLN
jgi:glucose 1-dehydrogenase